MAEATSKTRLAVIGAGPGGYPAAFHAADKGMEVVLIDLEENPGGVCLFRGCIPTKTLLHVTEVIRESREAKHWGVEFEEPKVSLDALRAGNALARAAMINVPISQVTIPSTPKVKPNGALKMATPTP